MSNPAEVVYAPYNFVPLAPAVYRPDWASKAGHDRPFADGLSGTIPLRIEARSPLLVGGRRTRSEGRPVEVAFVAAPDGARQPFIPGSSLRGLIRAVVEIAGFGRMRYVDDRRFAFRDLTAGLKSYRDRMTGQRPLPADHGGTERAFTPRVDAGWLRFEEDGHWSITPCRFARIERRDVLPNIPDKAPYPAAKKYRAYGFPGRSLEGCFEIDPLRAHVRHKAGPLGYALARRTGRMAAGARPGILVFTGQPNDRKHMEFVFHDPDPGRRLAVPAAVMTAFRAIHAADPQRANTRGRSGGLDEGDIDTWTFWSKPEHQADVPGIPVFYLTDASGAVESLGLSMMYKLPYRASVHDLLRRHGAPEDGLDGPHLSEDGPDLADTLFGYVREGRDGAGEAVGAAALKGRVSFGHARATGPARETRHPAAILSAPKPSYLPNYVVQPHADPAGRLPDGKGTHYASYEDDGREGRTTAELRGWKRYPVRRDACPQQIPPTLTSQTAIQSLLRTLDAGTRFVGEMRLHNVRPAELGALLFALRLSAAFEADGPERWHALGLGKPFGFGAVVLDPGVGAESWGEATLVANDPDRAPPSPSACLSAFAAEMDAFCRRAGLPAWAETLQIKALLAMAEPDRVRSGSLEMTRSGDAVTTSGGAIGAVVQRDEPGRQTVGYGPAHPLASMPLQDFAARKRSLRALPEYCGQARRPAQARPAVAGPRPAASHQPAVRSRAGFRFLRGDIAFVDGELCTVLEDVSEQAFSRDLAVQVRIGDDMDTIKAKSLRPAAR